MTYILTIIFTLLSAYYDAVELKAGRYFKDHTPRALFRVLVLFIISVLFNTHVLILLSVFYLIFDTMLNVFWGKPWNYIGNTSTLDKFKRRFGKYATIIDITTKIILIIITTNLQWITEYLWNGLFGQ